MVRSFVSASTMKITTVHNVAISRGLGSVSDYGDQELVNLEVINHLVTTVKPEVILGLMLLKNLDVFFPPHTHTLLYSYRDFHPNLHAWPLFDASST
ncbi:PREDICTED: PRUPE_5G227300 [Prunus dulcis]|uniref:PREDICTED: PRUPE_5G227300 n=1 Tax=Prunus dulcis TaxID=3755 RepID=A0A5E4G052_PRUDU|nr:PREDICTED: PRUPE_5G227300 [Prunus dulcis]